MTLLEFLRIIFSHDDMDQKSSYKAYANPKIIFPYNLLKVLGVALFRSTVWWNGANYKLK